MKRFHVHAHVADLHASIAFYSKLFAAEPTRVETDYVKWMLDDPRINFAISTRGASPGVRTGRGCRRRRRRGRGQQVTGEGMRPSPAPGCRLQTAGPKSTAGRTGSRLVVRSLKPVARRVLERRRRSNANGYHSIRSVP